VNKKELLSTTLSSEERLRFNVPIDIWKRNTPAKIEFLHPDSISPSDVGVSQDPRELAFAFKEMIISECR